MQTQSSPTSSELRSGLAIVMAIAETVRELGEVPSGTLYATLLGRVTLGGYNTIIDTLTRAGLIEVTGHLVRWIGPTKVG